MRSLWVYIAVVLSSVCCWSESIAEDYRIAVRAHLGIDEAYKLWQPTVDYLNQQLPDNDFVLLPIVSLDEITRRAAGAEFDFVLTNPSSFVEVEVLHGAKALLTLNNKRGNTAQDRFGSVIFTHVRNVDILTIADLKGKKLMAVAESAFGGWRVAWKEMLGQGFDPHTDLKALLFTESETQAEVVTAVREGKVDAGVVRTDLLERLEAKGDVDMRYFRIINNQDVEGFPYFLSTKLYPEWALAVMSDTSPELAQQVKDALLALPADHAAAVTGGYVGWLSPRDYASA